MFNEYPDIMSVEQLAKALGIGRNSAYALVRSRTIGSKRVGRKIIVPKACGIDYVRSARYNINTVTADNLTVMEGEKNDR